MKRCKMLTMMASSNWNIIRVAGPLWGESTGHRWIPLTKASDVELWCFLWSAPEQTVEQTIETPVILDGYAKYVFTGIKCDNMSLRQLVLFATGFSRASWFILNNGLIRHINDSLLLTWNNFPAWISNYAFITMWDETTYPFPNFNFK